MLKLLITSLPKEDSPAFPLFLFPPMSKHYLSSRRFVGLSPDINSGEGEEVSYVRSVIKEAVAKEFSLNRNLTSSKARKRRKRYEKARNKAKTAPKSKKRKRIPSYEDFIDQVKVRNPDNPDGPEVTLRTLKTKDKDSQAYRVYQRYIKRRQEALEEQEREDSVSDSDQSSQGLKEEGELSLKEEIKSDIKKEVLKEVSETLTEEMSEEIKEEVVNEVSESLNQDTSSKKEIGEIASEAREESRGKGQGFFEANKKKLLDALKKLKQPGPGDLGDLAAMGASLFLILFDSNAGQQMLDRITEDLRLRADRSEQALKALSEVKASELHKLLNKEAKEKLKEELGIDIGPGTYSINVDKLLEALQQGEDSLDEDIIEELYSFFTNFTEEHLIFLAKYIDRETGDIDLKKLRQDLREGSPSFDNEMEGEEEGDAPVSDAKQRLNQQEEEDFQRFKERALNQKEIREDPERYRKLTLSFRKRKSLRRLVLNKIAKRVSLRFISSF